MKKKQYRYLQVKKELFDYIQGLPDQTRIPPRTELVERFHVTRTTVDRAISELIGKGYLTSKIGSGTYVVKGKTSPLEPNQSIDNWGLILPNIAKDSYPELVRAVEDVCCASMINLIICNTDNDSHGDNISIHPMCYFECSGGLMIGNIKSAGLPFTAEQMERHGHTQEAQMPESQPIVFLVAPATDAPRPNAKDVKAVIIPKGYVAVLDRGEIGRAHV